MASLFTHFPPVKVCFSSDHGDMLGDGNKWGKQVPGQASIAVPLVCRGPSGLTLGGGGGGGGGFDTGAATSSSASSSSSLGHWPPARVRRGMIIQQPVSIADLGPTFLDVAGITKGPTMTGRSLLPVLLGYATPHQVRRVVTSALKDWRVAVASVRQSWFCSGQCRCGHGASFLSMEQQQRQQHFRSR